MNRSFNKKFFDSMIKVVHVILKYSVIALFVLLGILGVVFLVALFLPKSLFDFDLQLLENTQVTVMNVVYDLEAFGFTGVINVKWMFVLAVFAAIGNLSFYQFVQIQLKKLMKNVREGSPFSESSTGYLKYMGIGFLVASVVLPIINGSLFMVIINQLEIFEATINFSLDIQLLFTGVLILILGYIFDYGAYLQEEHNLTV